MTTPITERRYVLPLVLVTSLFFVWAIGVNLNDILIQHLKKAFGLTICYSYVFYFALRGYRPSAIANRDTTLTLPAGEFE